MIKHWYGEIMLNGDTPPDRATGLIIREWFEVDEIDESSLVSKILRLIGCDQSKDMTYFIFRYVSGSYDYGYGVNSTCGAYECKLGYWHFKSKRERDKLFLKKMVSDL